MNDSVTNATPLAETDDEISLLDLLQVVADNLRLLILGPLAVGLLALAISFLVPPTYTAKTQFLPPQQQQSAAASMLQSLGSLGGLAGAAAGVKFVFSTTNDAPTLHGLMLQEKVTHSAGVPTVWLAMFQHLDATAKAGGDASLGKLRLVTIGGSAAPRAMIERLMKQGVRVAHAWGMTETSPIGTMGAPTYDWDDLSLEAQIDVVCKQGRVPFGVELRIVDDEGTVLPRDGTSSGKLQVRGPWVVKRYFKAEADATDADQWFDTGDVSVIHPDGTMQITDRAKDVIKSGGEWISSVELENAAVGCPGVAEAAAIGVHHPKWDERPILLVVRKEGASLSEEDVTNYLAGVVAKWWLPDEVLFVDSLPHTGTGKIQKAELRKQYKDYQLKALQAA